MIPSLDTWYEQDANPNDNDPRLGEPAVIFQDGVFHMWYASYNIGQGDQGGSPLVIHATASDPRGPWTKFGPVDVSGFWGHPDVIYDPERNLYVMICLSDNPLTTLRNGGLNFYTSPSVDGPWTAHPSNPVFNAQEGLGRCRVFIGLLWCKLERNGTYIILQTQGTTKTLEMPL